MFRRCSRKGKSCVSNVDRCVGSLVLELAEAEEEGERDEDDGADVASKFLKSRLGISTDLGGSGKKVG